MWGSRHKNSPGGAIVVVGEIRERRGVGSGRRLRPDPTLSVGAASCPPPHWPRSGRGHPGSVPTFTVFRLTREAPSTSPPARVADYGVGVHARPRRRERCRAPYPPGWSRFHALDGTRQPRNHRSRNVGAPTGWDSPRSDPRHGGGGGGPCGLPGSVGFRDLMRDGAERPEGPVIPACGPAAP